MQDRKRQDMQDDKELHIELNEPILRCCFDVINELGSGFLESVYKKCTHHCSIILIILPLAILHIMFFLEVVKHVVSEFLNIFCLSLSRYKIIVKVIARF